MRGFTVTLSALGAWATLISHASATTRGVFCHYLIGGITADQAVTDVVDAKALGIDAFALNVDSTESWSTEAVQLLFDAAYQEDFKLFFSFDMTHFTEPDQFLYLIEQYYTNDSYYLHDDLPFVSTFYGGTLDFGYDTVNDGWQALYTDALSAKGISTYFVPAFSDSTVAPEDMYSAFPVADGLFNWDSWANATVGAVVEAGTDLDYMAGAAAADKSFIMGISALQFRHIDTYDNWWRGGALDLPTRITQILKYKPDYVEIQTWNDGGESHYIGNIWPYAVSTAPAIRAQIESRPHKAFQLIYKELITAIKNGDSEAKSITPVNGAAAEGIFWHHTLLNTASCSNDSLGKPGGIDLIENVVCVAITLSEAAGNTTINVWSDGELIGSEPGSVGLNFWSAPNINLGKQYVEVVNSEDNSVIISAKGNLSVEADADLCNFNYQVVQLA